MSVENRIFWLVVGVLSFFLVFSGKGRDYINRFVHGAFGYGVPGAGGSSPAPVPTPAFAPNPKDPTPAFKVPRPGSNGSPIWGDVPMT